MDIYAPQIAAELGIAAWQVNAAISLLEDSATVPFISRYRKEATGSLDEVAVLAIRDRTAQLRDLDERRKAILASLEERGLLSDELRRQVMDAGSMTALEDIYLPHRPKRRTRATVAMELGLLPLAEAIIPQDGAIDPLHEARRHVNPETGVESVEDALAGARDIIAHIISEDMDIRADVRRVFARHGYFRSTVVEGKEGLGANYRDYFDWEEHVRNTPSHRALAMFRGEREGVLRLKVAPPEEFGLAALRRQTVEGDSPASMQVWQAAQDSYRRLIAPAMENELRQALKNRADQEATAEFAGNLRQLLLEPPLGQKRVLAIDPGFRTGCKVVCLDPQGALLHTDTIYPLDPHNDAVAAAERLVDLARRYDIEAIAVGNGTGGRETQAFARGAGLDGMAELVMVNEDGASVYSASEAAREELPDHDVTVRGAVSIGRRLLDPLAELVKIDPKSIGVGQYQHDVDSALLRRSLNDVVVSCVNLVGVEVNTASKRLLTYVSGIGPSLAQNIVNHVRNNGPFSDRQELLDVPRLGPKAFQQAAGFLRISGGAQPLDATAIHPESYDVVEGIARDNGLQVADLIGDENLFRGTDLGRYVTETVGMPTLTDIVEELARPGRDPRPRLQPFSFAEDVRSIEDIQPGMWLSGIVSNITSFGAFVDLGVHTDGLLHISKMSEQFIHHPSDIVQVRQQLNVRVLEVDLARRRIALSLLEEREAP